MSDCSMKMKEKHCLLSDYHLKFDDLFFDSTSPHFAWFPPSLIEIFSLILNSISLTQQYIVSLDFFHLFLMFHPCAGSSFKQDDVWRMQLNGSYRNRGLNLQFLFITSTVENKSLFIVLPLLWRNICYMCVLKVVWPDMVIANQL